MGQVAKPRIALVHDFLNVIGGAELVLKELHNLFPEAPIYTAVANAELVASHFPNATIHTSWLNTSWKRKFNPLLLANMPMAVESYDLSAYDIVLSSSGAFSHGVITGPDTVHICYCHSPMRYAWDWHAEYAVARGAHKNWLSIWAYESLLHNVRLWDTISAKRVDVWLANSTRVQERIHQYYRATASVIYPPVDTDYYNPQNLTEPAEKGSHAFTVSRLTPSKRIDQMIRACHASRVPLRIAGRGDQAWCKEIATTLGADVTFLGPISDQEKRQELARAAVFLFPAEDDFGIAPVEAMAMGTPVVAFGKGGATETVVRGKTGILYDEPTDTALAQAIEKALSQEWNTDTIRHQAEKFSTEHFRQAITQLVESHGK